MRIIAAALAAAMMMGIYQHAGAQGFPNKPMRIVTAFTAGSTGDIIARVTAAGMSPLLGQSVVVENRPGAGGVIAAELVARAGTDGHTLLVVQSGVQVMRTFTAQASSFDAGKELTPITRIGESTTVFVAHPSVPVNSFRELLDYAKKNPGKIAYGTSGVGTQTHMAGEMVRLLSGADLNHIPYKAVATALQDVVSGQLPTSWAILGLVTPLQKSGKVKVLAVLRDERNAALPGVPTVSEIVPGFERPPTWTGLSVAAGTPEPIVRRLHADAVRALNEPGAVARLADGAALEVMTNKSPEEFSALILRQIEQVRRIVKQTGIEPQ
jgi:tripartite-type tricarboxylate transporter receptor subunit TctC